MVIYGYSTLAGINYFDIDDPIYGKSHLTVNDFTNNYQGSGSWTHTYMTKSYYPILPPFKWIEIHYPILDIVWQTRPLLNPTIGGRQTDQPDETWRRASLALAHRVYTLDLNELTKKKTRISAATPVAVRVLESEDNQLKALFDVTDEEKPRVQQMSASQPYLEKLSRGIGLAATLVQNNQQAESKGGKRKKESAEVESAELRLLKVPALNFEAFWLYTEGKEADWLVPIISLGELTPFEPVSVDDAMEALSRQAEAVAEMDDMMGA